MKKLNSFSAFFFMLFLISGCIVVFPQGSDAAGISIDAGLTPSANRWIVRSQLRYMQRQVSNGNEPKMEAFMVPVVIAYGVKSNLMIMSRQILIRREMTMMGSTLKNSGLSDFLLVAKYRLYRVNTASYTLGIAPTLGIEFPTGNNEFSSDSYNLRFGTFFSGRIDSWGLDLNLTYLWHGMITTGETNLEPGHEFSIETALANQMSFGNDAEKAIAPVIELSYQKVLSDSYNGQVVENSGESVVLLSPGFKLTISSVIFESLIQFPIWQKQNGIQTERKPGFLVGIRLMN